MKAASALVVAVLMCACHSTSSYDRGMASSGAPNGSVPAPDIAGIVTVASQGEIDQAKAVLPRLTNADARDFANMMIVDHSAALQMAQNVFGTNRIQIRDTNSTAVSLKSRSGALVKQLEPMAMPDRTYIQAQVQQHQDLLRMLDEQLIPSSSGELRVFLQKQRETVAIHVVRAQSILESMR